MTTWTHTHILSDTHGWFDLMIEMLAEKGLVTEDGEWIGGESQRIIHLGDMPDRGPDSVKVIEWFRTLQQDLGPEQVVRLIGNHDFAFCGGPVFGGLDQAVYDAGLDKALTEDGKAGTLKFAHHLETKDGDWLLVHGGLDPRAVEGEPMSLKASEIAEHINEVGLDFFNHFDPRWRMRGLDEATRQNMQALEEETAILTGISHVRGGYDRVSGVTWADIVAELNPQHEKLQVRQIVGHRSHDEITFYEHGKLIGVNVHYGLAQLLTYDHDSGEFSKSKLHRSETHQWDDWRGPLWK